jgi:hypothetical protein
MPLLLTTIAIVSFGGIVACTLWLLYVLWDNGVLSDMAGDTRDRLFSDRLWENRAVT